MYAVIKTGGKQYRVAAGEKLKIEQIPAEVGAEITLDQILMVGEGESVKIGAPLVSDASVKATVLSQGRHKKVNGHPKPFFPEPWQQRVKDRVAEAAIDTLKKSSVPLLEHFEHGT